LFGKHGRQLRPIGRREISHSGDQLDERVVMVGVNGL
jgi:hypothetical protein